MLSDSADSDLRPMIPMLQRRVWLIVLEGFSPLFALRNKACWMWNYKRLVKGKDWKSALRLFLDPRFVSTSTWKLTGTSLANWMNLVGERHFLTLHCCFALLCFVFFERCLTWKGSRWILSHRHEKIVFWTGAEETMCAIHSRQRCRESLSWGTFGGFVCKLIGQIEAPDSCQCLYENPTLCLGVHICSLLLQNFLFPAH